MEQVVPPTRIVSGATVKQRSPGNIGRQNITPVFPFRLNSALHAPHTEDARGLAEF